MKINLHFNEQKHEYLLILCILSSSAGKLVAATFSVLQKRANLLQHSHVCQRVKICVLKNTISFDSIKGKFLHG